MYPIYKSCSCQSLAGEILPIFLSTVSVIDFPNPWFSTIVPFTPSVAGSRDTTSNGDVRTCIIQELVGYYM